MPRRSAKTVTYVDEKTPTPDDLLQEPKKIKVSVPRMSENPELCAHTIFVYLNENKTTQICTVCQSRRRLYRDRTNVTVGSWQLPVYTG